MEKINCDCEGACYYIKYKLLKSKYDYIKTQYNKFNERQGYITEYSTDSDDEFKFEVKSPDGEHYYIKFFENGNYDCEDILD